MEKFRNELKTPRSFHGLEKQQQKNARRQTPNLPHDQATIRLVNLKLVPTEA